MNGKISIGKTRQRCRAFLFFLRLSRPFLIEVHKTTNGGVFDGSTTLTSCPAPNVHPLVHKRSVNANGTETNGTRPAEPDPRLARQGGSRSRAQPACRDELCGVIYPRRNSWTLCPITGQPDFAHLVIDYEPARFLVESKSLKLYLNSFRNHGAFHERLHRRYRKKAIRAAEAEVAAHRRLLVSAWRHADRCVLAGRKIAQRRMGARSGRRALPRTRLTFRDLRRTYSAQVHPVDVNAAAPTNRTAPPHSDQTDAVNDRPRRLTKKEEHGMRCGC